MLATPRASLAGEQFEIVVIGGGINGVAIARLCALAGRQTLLLERHDFAAGTTSRSTRIIHGGLRYLEYGELSLVRESLQDRARLLRDRPYLVRPLNFLLALPPDGRRSVLEIRLGLWLYRKLGGTPRPLRAHQLAAQLERLLDSGQRWSVLCYEDAQCEFPERLVAEWLLEGVSAGLMARNYTEVLAVETASGRVTGVRFRDLLAAEEGRISAVSVINATGPWADSVCHDSGIRTPAPMIGGVRGSHIVLPLLPGAPEGAIYTEAADARPVFLIPWNQQLLVGTTEVADSSDARCARPSSQEVTYLLDAVHRLFPRWKVGIGDIRFAWAGIRPLPFVPSSAPSSITRRHFLHDHADEGAAGMTSVIGGKLTTAASLARQCVAGIGIVVNEPQGWSLGPDGQGFPAAMTHWSQKLSELGNISPISARALAQWHGPGSKTIAQLAAGDESMRLPLCPHTPHLVAEAVHAMRSEFAATLADVFLRRVPVGLGPCWSGECTRVASQRVGAVLGWTESEVSRNAEACEAERAEFLSLPDPRSLSPFQ
ncbi:MAG TPA: glycerol-3-phosphate dehydrogenase/oxidase [Terriglobales bacterium]|nr:glycerol-3-phosphate dehydrogenase/oxidase [Terriglobales bacterium]